MDARVTDRKQVGPTNSCSCKKHKQDKQGMRNHQGSKLHKVQADDM